MLRGTPGTNTRLLEPSQSAGKTVDNARTIQRSGVDEADFSPRQAEQAGQRVDQPSTSQTVEEMPRELHVEVGFGEWALEAEVLGADAHPAMEDTSGNGLTDYEEMEEGYTVMYTSSAEDTREFLEAVQVEEDGEEPDLADLEAAIDEHMEVEEGVTTKPMLVDSNGDGFDDYQNRKAGTHPDRVDTTDDGIPDEVALADEELDPTLHDASPPVINIEEAAFDSPSGSWKTHYEIEFAVEDPSGVDRVVFLKDGDEYADYEFGGNTDDRGEVSFTVEGWWESILDGLVGASVEAEASDVHDNSQQTVALERSNFYGEVAGDLDEETIYAEPVAVYLGGFAGLTTGAGETAELVELLLTNPEQVREAFEQLAELLQDAKLLAELIKQLPEALNDQQKLVNPYEEGGDLYEEFKVGYYTGYAFYFLAEALATGGAASVLGDSARFQTFVSTIDPGVLRYSYGLYASANRALSAPIVLVGVGSARAISAGANLGTTALRQVSTGVSTAGKQLSLRISMRQLESPNSKVQQTAWMAFGDYFQLSNNILGVIELSKIIYL